MRRLVNDYKIVDKILVGYRPVLPFEIKDVGCGTQAMMMEKTDADYKADQVKKQIENDKICGLGGHDLDRHKDDINQEALFLISYWISMPQMLGITIRKMLGINCYKYVDKVLTRKQQR